MSRYWQQKAAATGSNGASLSNDDGLGAVSEGERLSPELVKTELLTHLPSDICPVCKSSRYMNPNMRFLVNPDCYHRMCSSCVDRIFAAGRAKCPIAKCPKMLRKAGFRKQVFDDVKMEREKDIRGEIAQVFNRREDEFETLRDYNDYLEMVEDISFGLINGVDVEENQKKLDRYKESNTADIRANQNLARNEETRFSAIRAQEKEQARLRRENARRAESEERREAEEGRRAIVDAIASGQGDANAIARTGEERLKKSKLRREASDRQPIKLDTTTNDGTFAIRGLKKQVQPEAEKPYDPFGGITFQMARITVSAAYDLHWLNDARKDPLVAAGGYDIEGYCERLLAASVCGLGVFIEDDKR